LNTGAISITKNGDKNGWFYAMGNHADNKPTAASTCNAQRR
jgi:hypothetical protein